jgi:hypothetical protein
MKKTTKKLVKMSNIVKASLICGLVFTLIGSFLPWQREGDFLSYLTYGIRVGPSIEDNGGILIIFLSLNVLLLIFRPLKFIESPLIWSIVSSFVLMLACIFHITKLFISQKNASGVIGASTIEVGLVLVSIGSILLFFASLLHYLNSMHQKPQLPR